MVKKQATENKRQTASTTLFRTKETKDQKTSTVEMCIILIFSDILLTLDILCDMMYSKEVQYMNIDDWKSQIKRGTLDFCILLMIRQRPSYGYKIISTLEKYPILAAKENTIYPLLRRLMKEEYVSSSWQESAEGLPPRKYYSITDKGLEYISAMSQEWNNLLNAINEIKGE